MKKHSSLLHIVSVAALLLGAPAGGASLSGAGAPLPSDGFVSDSDSDNPDVSLSPYFQVKGAEAGVDALPLKSTQVDAVIGGVVAEVRVVQTYQNEGATPLEARYVFPASTRAAVHGMTMTVGERRIEAQIKEKEEARKTYETAKREGKTASLLESHRSNVFEMNVANILPGDTVTVELRYNELITPSDGEYEWVFPTVVGPRYTRAAGAAGAGRMTQDPGLSAGVGAGARQTVVPVPYAKKGGAENEPVFSLSVDVLSGSPVKKVKCVSHRVETTDIDGGVRVTLPPRAEVAMNRDFILRYKLAGDALASGLLLDEFKGEKYFLLMVQPPARVEPAMVPPRDYLFVMDVSGSMMGFPLNVSAALLREMLLNLRAQDTFNVLLFSGGNRVLFDAPVAATPENIAQTLALFEARSFGGGGTELLPALKRALAMPRAQTGASRSIIVVTDGYVDVEAEAYALVRENLGDANLFAFGIGTAVNRELMERLARAGKSEAVIVDNEHRAAAAAEKLRKMIEAPVLTHVRATIAPAASTIDDTSDTSDTGDASVSSATSKNFPLPDVHSQRPIILCAKWPSGVDERTGVIHISGQSGAGPWSADARAADAVNLNGRGTLALLWARERLWDLKDLHAQRVDAEKQKTAIVELGLKYNLLTPFTSFVAVDMTPRISEKAAAQAKKVTQALPLPQGVSEQAVGADDSEGVPTSPEPETWALMIVAALAASAMWWRRKGKLSVCRGLAK